MNEKTAEYWESENKSRGDGFQWGGMSSPALAEAILDFAGPNQRFRIFVAGAGTSYDALELKKAFQLPASQVVAPDFTAKGASFQAELGVEGVLADLLTDQPQWQQSFDVVVDAAFTDVFTSNWSPTEGKKARGGMVKTKFSTEARQALRNLLGYLKPGGIFVAKSMVQNEEEYGKYVEAVLKQSYAPSRSFDASEMLALAREQTGGSVFAGGVSKYGRKRTLSVPNNFGFQGHVGIWRPAHGAPKGDGEEETQGAAKKPKAARKPTKKAAGASVKGKAAAAAAHDDKKDDNDCSDSGGSSGRCGSARSGSGSGSGAATLKGKRRKKT